MKAAADRPEHRVDRLRASTKYLDFFFSVSSRWFVKTQGNQCCCEKTISFRWDQGSPDHLSIAKKPSSEHAFF
jgi:hypothetical protein